MTDTVRIVQSRDEELQAKLHELRSAYDVAVSPGWQHIQKLLEESEAAIFRTFRTSEDLPTIHRLQGQLKTLNDFRNLAEVLAVRIKSIQSELAQRDRRTGE